MTEHCGRAVKEADFIATGHEFESIQATFQCNVRA